MVEVSSGEKWDLVFFGTCLEGISTTTFQQHQARRSGGYLSTHWCSIKK